MTEKKVEAHVAPDPAAAKYAAIHARCLALPVERLRPVNVSVPFACSTISGAVEELKKHLDAICEEMPKFDRANVELLAEFAEYADYTYSRSQALAPDKAAQDAYEKAVAARERLSKVAESCLSLGFAEGLDLAAAKAPPNSYANTPTALLTLSGFLLANRAIIEPKVVLPWDEITEARALAHELRRLAGLRNRSSSDTPEWDIAQRAFSVMVRAYEMTRVALGVVRFEQRDAFELAPSYFNRAMGGDRAKDDDVEESTKKAEGKDGVPREEPASPVVVVREAPASPADPSAKVAVAKEDGEPPLDLQDKPYVR
jgi:hypothetical protein